MATIKSKKEALRKKALGELGELFAIKALVDNEYGLIRNLNDTVMNYPFADLYAKKGKSCLVISVKARNKYQKDKKLNAYYKLGDDAYRKAEVAAEAYDAMPYWMAIQFGKLTYSIYLGSLKELNGKKAIPLVKCEEATVGICLVKEKRHYFDFDFFSN